MWDDLRLAGVEADLVGADNLIHITRPGDIVDHDTGASLPSYAVLAENDRL
jgi:hypothetical protein